MVRRRVQRLVSGRLVAHALHQVAHRHAGIRHGVSLRVGEDVHQRDQPAVAPADHADALGVEERVVLQHPLAAQVDVIHFAPAVIDLLVKSAAVARTAAIVRRNDRVALRQQFAENVGVARVLVGVYALMAEDQQRLLPRAVQILGNEGVRADDQRIAGARGPRVADMRRRQAGVLHLVDVGDIVEHDVPHQVVDPLEHFIVARSLWARHAGAAVGAARDRRPAREAAQAR